MERLEPDSGENFFFNKTKWDYPFKEIVSRDFAWLQMILMNRIGVPDVPLKVNFFKIYFFILLIKF